VYADTDAVEDVVEGVVVEGGLVDVDVGHVDVVVVAGAALAAARAAAQAAAQAAAAARHTERRHHQRLQFTQTPHAINQSGIFKVAQAVNSLQDPLSARGVNALIVIDIITMSDKELAENKNAFKR